MRTKIIPDEEESLDDLVVRARSDSKLRKMLAQERVEEVEASVKELVFISDGQICRINFKGEAGLHTPILEFATSIANIGKTIYFTNEDGIIQPGSRKQPKSEFVERIYRGETSFYKLYHDKEIPPHSQYIDAYDLKMRQKWTLRPRDKVTAMSEHNAELYYACGDKVFNQNGAIVCYASSRIEAMCYYEGARYTVNCRDIYARGFAEYHRPGLVRSLHVHNGILLDAGEYGIWETLTEKKIITRSSSCLLSVPKHWKGKVIK
jgi:hypothetical protein